MSSFDRFCAVLRIAARIYQDAAVGQHAARASALALAKVASTRLAAAEELDPQCKSDFSAPNPLSGTLDNCALESDFDKIVLKIETEVLRFGEYLYFGDFPPEMKRVLEPLIAGAEELLGAVASELPERGKGAPAEEAIAKGTPPATDAEVFPLWFSTNREPLDPSELEAGFGPTRSNGEVRYGRCLVHVPKSHRIGSLGGNVLVRVLRGVDERLTLEKIDVLPTDTFWSGVGSHASEAGDGHHHALVFLHGYNVSFEEAALRTAQIGFDLGVRGPVTFFSWPSRGSVRGYFADSDAIAASALAITDFLVSLANIPAVSEVHIIAHSMGNRGLLSAVSRIAADAERLSGGRFGQFLLAAADVDTDVFRNDAAAYVQLGERTTLYVSDRDKALSISTRISNFARAGFHPPVSIMEGIDTIDVGGIDLDRLGHGYVGNERGVLADMHRLIYDGTAPEGRFGLERKSAPKGSYWSFRR